MIRMKIFIKCLLLTGFIIGSTLSFTCPLKCHCRENVTWVKCQSALIKIPELPNHIEYLDLSHNFLGPVITKPFFHFKELVHLDLSYNGLTNMTERGLRGLIKLEVLILSNNHIPYLPKNMFCDNTNLRILDVSNNLFRVMPDSIFRSLDNLRYFSIRNNKLKRLKLGPRWQVPTKLKELDFSNNKFDNISHDAFEFTSYWDVTMKRSLNLRNCGIKFIENGTLVQFKGLHDLDLSDNPGLGGERLNHLLLELEGSRIKRLDFSGMRLTTIQSLFQDVDQLSLEYLNLADNFFRDIPVWAVGNVRSLQHLNISNNNLASDIIGLKDLGNLITLDLSFNQLLKLKSDVTSQTSRLTFLDISHNQIQKTSDLELSSLQNLQYLNVSHNKLEGLVLPGNTSDLRVLNFAANQITELFSIQNINKLSHFDISGNKLTSLASFLFSQTYNFLLANFSSNKISDIDHRSFLPSAPNVIDLSHNSLTEVKFASWTDASKIILHHNEIIEISYQAFYGMSGLNSLDLSFNKLSSLPEVTFRYLVQLHQLNLAHNSLNIKPDVFVDVLKPLKSLKILDLSHNELSDINITTFGSCPNIERLTLSYNQFSFIPLTLFNHLNNLTYLDAAGNPFICDCSLIPFRDWIKDNLKTKMRQSYNRTKYTCINPIARKGITIIDFREERFECNESLLFMIIFGSIGGFLILVGIIGSLSCHYYRKWRKKNPRIKTKRKKSPVKVDRIRKKVKAELDKIAKSETQKTNKIQNGGSRVPYMVNETEGRLALEKDRRLPQYRASKFNLPQVLPSEPAENWQKLRSRNDPRRFHTVNPRIQNPHVSWDRWNWQQPHNVYSTMPFPSAMSQYDVNKSRPERGVTFDVNIHRHRQSVDDTYVDNYRHRYKHPRDLHRHKNMNGYGERKYSMPNVYVQDKQTDWV
ncbi:hypothetical protein SNE40_001197 [Patella caerulea]|uniref:LRRCT domain-containing protein n=2 Tax=Patella caerulea TaxID=87958 RepID=A0AAN8KDI8_PATCE